MKKFQRLVLVVFVVCLVAGNSVIATNPPPDLAIMDCKIENNMDAKANSFIPRCRKGTITSKFPMSVFSKTLKEIKNGSSSDHKKAWELLNDKQYFK